MKTLAERIGALGDGPTDLAAALRMYFDERKCGATVCRRYACPFYPLSIEGCREKTPQVTCEVYALRTKVEQLVSRLEARIGRYDDGPGKHEVKLVFADGSCQTERTVAVEGPAKGLDVITEALVRLSDGLLAESRGPAYILAASPSGQTQAIFFEHEIGLGEHLIRAEIVAFEPVLRVVSPESAGEI